MPPSPPLTSIVCLCHNDWFYLEKCLKSVSRHTRLPHEIIVVDNASTDGSTQRLKRALSRQKNVKLILNESNLFFAAGNNQGILASRGEYVVLLNADAVVGPEWLERLIRCAEREERIAVAAPCTNHAVGVQIVRKPGYKNMGEFPSFAKRWAARHDGLWEEAHRLIGFCLLIKRPVIDKVGLLDERFGPGGYEDYDYCIRVQRAGLTLALAKDVFIHHFGGKGYGGMNYDGHRLINREILARKWNQFLVHALDEIDDVIKHDGEPPPSAPSLIDKASKASLRG